MHDKSPLPSSDSDLPADTLLLERFYALQSCEGNSDQVLALFREVIWSFYRSHGRDLPWRRTHDPYRILVSEMMLQQTQVARVLRYYPAFLEQFPDVQMLAAAGLPKVLAVWQGLGYNRRAKALLECARIIVAEYNAVVPADADRLRRLPGIGAATAGEILAFAFNRPVVFIETNIRRVFLHFFFPGRTGVKDRDIVPLIEKTVDRENPRDWYYALMDAGSWLGRSGENANLRSEAYTRQSAFEGSDRQLRGEVLRQLLKAGRIRSDALPTVCSSDPQRTWQIIDDLISEGFVVRDGHWFSLAV
jgi:A/G-specific adenine glycosylase